MPRLEYDYLATKLGGGGDSSTSYNVLGNLVYRRAKILTNLTGSKIVKTTMFHQFASRNTELKRGGGGKLDSADTIVSFLLPRHSSLDYQLLPHISYISHVYSFRTYLPT